MGAVRINFSRRNQNYPLDTFFTTVEEEDQHLETSEIDLDQYEEIN
ncbi:hypothetical protein JW851_04915 [Candidatus Woesearchaeota archaeon]|nr:hypothetical protein [Candidatus Woesearchaeota archaeon]